MHRAILATALLGIVPTLSLAQDVGGQLEGRVAAPDGTAVVGANVVVEGPTLMAARAAMTDADGRFRVLALPVGAYTLRVTHPEFEATVVEDVVVRLGGTTGLPPIVPRPLSRFEERVEVVAKRPLIDPVSTSVGGNLGEAFFGNLPVDRTYQDVAALLPFVVPSYLGDGPNFLGATGIENRYFVDGLDVSDPYRGSQSTALPHDFVQEVEARMGGYEAEYRSALGAVVNVVTPSGSDRLAGKAFGYYAGSRFAGEPRAGALEPSKGDYAQYDVGFSLGGPIVRERLRYFLAYNPASEREDVEVPGIGYQPDEVDIQRFAAKLDWQVDPANRLTFSLMGDPWTRNGVGATFWSYGTPIAFENPDPYLARVEGGGMTAGIRSTHLVGPKLLLETWLTRLANRVAYRPRTERGREEVLFIDGPTGIWSGGYPEDFDNRTTQWTVGGKATWSAGRHEVKAGAEYRNDELRVDMASDYVQRFGELSFFEAIVRSEGTVHNRITSVFAQDSWALGDRFTLNYGLRWDVEDFIDSKGRTAQTIGDEFAPRLGFVYRPGAAGSQRVYGSVARFYQELNSYVLPYYYIEGTTFVFRYCEVDPRVDPSGCEDMPIAGQILPEVAGLRGQHHDELTLGYERRVGEKSTLGVRAIRRRLKEAIDDSLDEDSGTFQLGNPGRGVLEEYPRPIRKYDALELTWRREADARYGWLVSYVLSRSEGNYPGLYLTDMEVPLPNGGAFFDVPDMLVNGYGRLPNDRPHVFKASGSYRFAFGLNVGSSLVWATGTPLSERGPTSYGGLFYGFIQPRGSVGRTPTLFDLSLRLDYRFKMGSSPRVVPRLILDVFHLFSDRTPVAYDQTHYFSLDESGNYTDPNPTYGMPTHYAPPTTARIGLEVSF